MAEVYTSLKGSAPGGEVQNLVHILFQAAEADNTAAAQLVPVHLFHFASLQGCHFRLPQTEPLTVVSMSSDTTTVLFRTTKELISEHAFKVRIPMVPEVSSPRAFSLAAATFFAVS